MNKKQYLIWAAKNMGIEKICPSCGSKKFHVVDKKYVVTKLLECGECFLQYRFPVDSPTFNEEFYQEEYEEKGLTTDLPDESLLNDLLGKEFKDSEKDFSRHIKTINAIGKGNDPIKVVDFGANWGYATWQFRKAGFSVEPYEISKDRANFAKKIGVEIKTELESVREGNDVFFSSHVIEHHPKISDMLNFAKSRLNEDGVFIAYCPNGSSEFRKVKPNDYHYFWGLVHPNLLSAKFYKEAFKDVPYAIGSASSEKEMISEWDGNSQMVFDLSDPEIIVFAKLNKKLN